MRLQIAGKLTYTHAHFDRQINNNPLKRNIGFDSTVHRVSEDFLLEFSFSTFEHFTMNARILVQHIIHTIKCNLHFFFTF